MAAACVVCHDTTTKTRLCGDCLPHLIGPKLTRDGTVIDNAGVVKEQESATSAADGRPKRSTRANIYLPGEQEMNKLIYERYGVSFFYVDGHYMRFLTLEEDMHLVLDGQRDNYDFVETAHKLLDDKATVYADTTPEQQKMFAMFDIAIECVKRVPVIEGRLEALWVNAELGEFYFNFDYPYLYLHDRDLKNRFLQLGITRVFTQSDVGRRWRQQDELIVNHAKKHVVTMQHYIMLRLRNALGEHGYELSAAWTKEETNWEGVTQRKLDTMVTVRIVTPEEASLTSSELAFRTFMRADPSRATVDLLNGPTRYVVPKFTHPKLSSELLVALRSVLCGAKSAAEHYTNLKRANINDRDYTFSMSGTEFPAAPRELRVLPAGEFVDKEEHWARFLELGVHFSDEQREQLIARVEELYNEELAKLLAWPLDKIDESLHAHRALYFRAPYMPRAGDTLWHGTKVDMVATNEEMTMRDESFFSTDMRMSISYVSSGMLLHRLLRDLPPRTVSLIKLAHIHSDNTRYYGNTTTHDLLAKVWARMFGYTWSRFTGAAEVVCRVWNTAMMVYMLQPTGSELGDNGYEIILCRPSQYIGKRLPDHLLSGLKPRYGGHQTGTWQNNMALRFGTMAIATYQLAIEEETVAPPAPVERTTWAAIRDATFVSSDNVPPVPYVVARKILPANTGPFVKPAIAWLSTFPDSLQVDVLDLAQLDQHLRHVLTRRNYNHTWYDVAVLLTIGGISRGLPMPSDLEPAQHAFIKTIHENVKQHPGLLLARRVYPKLLDTPRLRRDKLTVVRYTNEGEQPARYGLHF
jgi:hypothetical protein